jgi:DNA-binding MarR family transcriptional regulator
MDTHVESHRSLGYALKRLQQTLRGRMDAALAEFGLTAPQYAVLALLAAEPRISNAQLARRSFVTAPTMIRIVTGLEAAGLLSRSPVAGGGRAQPALLTDAGEQRLRVAAPHVQALEQALLQAAEPHTAEIVLRWLNTAADRLVADQPGLPGTAAG